MRHILAIVISLIVTNVFAQSVSTPMEQALSNKFFTEVNENLQLRMRLLELEKQIVELKKQLEAKKEPTPSPK